MNVNGRDKWDAADVRARVYAMWAMGWCARFVLRHEGAVMCGRVCGLMRVNFFFGDSLWGNVMVDLDVGFKGLIDLSENSSRGSEFLFQPGRKFTEKSLCNFMSKKGKFCVFHSKFISHTSRDNIIVSSKSARLTLIGII